MHFRPSEHSLNLLAMWHNMCVELNNNNQGAFNRVFSAGIRKEMDYYIMPKELYPHGALIEQVRKGIPCPTLFFSPMHRLCSPLRACDVPWPCMSPVELAASSAHACTTAL